jgi:Domain of unknown function (DUF4276)
MKKQVNIAVEDRLSETMLRLLLSRAKGKPIVSKSYPVSKGWEKNIGPSGYGYIKKSLPAFNAASAIIPFVILVDADTRPCPRETIKSWLGDETQNPNLVIRIAIREVEAWLLADRSGIADFLAIPESCVPLDPSRIKDPKRYLSRLAARSRRKEIRQDLARAPGTRSKTGPFFSQSLQYFTKNLWNISVARLHSADLNRTIVALDKI